MRGTLLALLIALPAPAPAQGMAEAARRLEAAGALLAGATGADDRLAALTETVRAYEEGLGLLREALRRSGGARATLEAELDADRAGIARLLGVLQSMGSSPAPVLMLHPSGPLGTARLGMILADAAPALQAEAEALRARLDALGALRAEEASALLTLEEGLASAQTARAELAVAAADRGALPRTYSEDAVATALLLASSETLDAFAAGLDATVADPLGVSSDAPSTTPMGTLPLPVPGVVLRGPGEPDAEGAARPGVTLAAEPRALVTTPVAATLRFRGPLLDYGTVVIIEPAPGTLFVIAGLAQAWGDAGEVLPAGAPLGLLGGEAHAILSEPPLAAGAGLSETLYLEVREGDRPVDPATWFALPEEQAP